MAKPALRRFAGSVALLALLAAAPAAAATGETEAGALTPALLDVTLNGQAMAEPLVLLRDASGGLYASAATLRQWRLRAPAAAPVRFEGEAYYRIDAMAALSARLSEADQSLVLDAAPELFEAQRSDFLAVGAAEMTPAAIGGFLNYDMLGEYSLGQASLGGVFEAGAFSRHGAGSTGFVARITGGTPRFTRLETSWSIDRPDRMSSIRIGDGVSADAPGAYPLRFGGLQFARNFSVRPGYITMPLPVLRGSAAVPSVIDVYVNETLQGSREVAPGPFELANVPIAAGGGTVQLVTRDLLGRQVVSEQNYYASSEMLRRGLHDFSYEIGFLRESFGVASNRYGAAIASTSHRYGLTDGVTAEASLQATRERQRIGAGATVAIGGFGVAGAAASLSRGPSGTAIFLASSIERRSSGLSFGARSEYAGAAFSIVGAGAQERTPRLSNQAFADLSLPGGSIGLNIVHRDHRSGEDEALAGLFANLRVGSSASVQLFARHSAAGRAETVLGAHVGFSFGGRRSASLGAEYQGGRMRSSVSLQNDAPAGIGSGWRTSASIGDATAFDSSYRVNMEAASLGAHLSRAGNSTGFRLSASGAVGLIGRRAFASRALGSSFAAVQVGDHEGVRVYADNQLVGTTGRGGSIVIPSLRSYDRNLIRIDEADLPLETVIDSTEIAVRPFARSAAIVRFSPRSERGALLQVRLADGRPLPAGAMVRIAGEDAGHVTASGGEVYLPALQGSATLEARWPGGSCSFTVTIPESDDPQPKVEGLVCAPAPVYAAR